MVNLQTIFHLHCVPGHSNKNTDERNRTTHGLQNFEFEAFFIELFFKKGAKMNWYNEPLASCVSKKETVSEKKEATETFRVKS